jgi:hypothetical protein
LRLRVILFIILVYRYSTSLWYRHIGIFLAYRERLVTTTHSSSIYKLIAGVLLLIVSGSFANYKNRHLAGQPARSLGRRQYSYSYVLVLLSVRFTPSAGSTSFYLVVVLVLLLYIHTVRCICHTVHTNVHNYYALLTDTSVMRTR